jgi:hypothetical protein
MTMAGKAQLRCQSRQIVVSRNEVQCPRQAQPQVISIQGNAFRLTEHLSQVYGRPADLSGDFRECPAPGKIAGQQDFDTVRQPAARMSRARLVRCAWSQATAHQVQHQALSLQWLNAPVLQAVPEQRDQRLGASVNALMLATKSEVSPVIQKRAGRELTQEGFRQNKRQACIASCDWMTDLIALTGIKEKHVVRIRHRLIAGDVSHVNATIGEHKMDGRGAFLRAPVTARAAAADVSQRYSICIQKMLDFELGVSAHIPMILLSDRSGLSNACLTNGEYSFTSQT